MARSYDFFSKPADVKADPSIPVKIPDEHDPDGEPFVFHLRKMSLPERMAAEDLAEHLVETHLVGDPENGVEPLPMIGPGGTMKLSEGLIRGVARIFTMQDAPEGEDACPMEQLFAMAHTREMGFDALTSIAYRIQTGWTPPEEGDEGADGTASPE
jgi:hypothetical protein